MPSDVDRELAKSIARIVLELSPQRFLEACDAIVEIYKADTADLERSYLERVEPAGRPS